MRAGITCGLLAAMLLFRAEARADDSARQHFDAGRRLRDGGDCARAIGEFEKSIASERSIGAFYNLGFCHEELGHRHDAYDAYRAAVELARQKHDGRLREISGALAALLETPHVRLVLPQPLPEGMAVKVDDEPVPPAAYAPETIVFTRANKYHLVVVTAPGFDERRLTVETKQVAPVELQKTPPRSDPPPASVSDVAPPSDGWSTQRWIGVGVAGGGVLAGVAAGILYARHRSDVSDIDATLSARLTKCGEDDDCRAVAQKEHNADISSANKKAYALVGSVGGVAVALLVTGAALFATGGGAKKSAAAWHILPVVSASARGAALVGTF